MINTLTLTGRFIENTEYVGENKKLIKFRFATNKNVKNKNGEWEKKGIFIDCKAFRSLEYLEKYGTKGKKATISGELDMDSWEDKEGNKRSKLLMIVNDVDIEYVKEGEEETNNEVKKETKSKTKKEENTDDLPF